MYFEILNKESRLPRVTSKAYWGGMMKGRARKSRFARESNNNNKRPHQDGQGRGDYTSDYFSVESFLVLICLTASMLILPLILPPLPPPPFLLLLLPICILAVLMFLALMPSDVRNIASSYL